jgi:anti-anti-sigma factor
MDTYKSQEIENGLSVRINVPRKMIVFDLEEVMYVSSYFLRLCLSTLKTVGTERFILKNVKSDIKKVFMIAGYDKLINIK